MCHGGARGDNGQEMTREEPGARYERYCSVIRGRPLPIALVDLASLEANVDAVVKTLGGVKMRVASKSIRSVALLRCILLRAGDCVSGIMTYTARETAFLHAQGFTDLLLAYPTLDRGDADALAAANRGPGQAAVVADAVPHLEVLSAAAQALGSRIPVVLDLDVSLRPGAGLHLGVRRSPLREAKDVVALARRVAGDPGLRFAGVMGYEAQIAGVPDHDPFASAMDAVRRAMKALSRRDVAKRRAEVKGALQAAGLAPLLFNGGGSGSILSSRADRALTEVTVGSAFLASHLFDHYCGLDLDPALSFALQVVRAPARGIVTCHGGGYVASGEAGASRLPLPWLPEGLALLPLEGAGEVQTPLRLPKRLALPPGAPVFFRHAKAGELAEHFAAYLLVRGSVAEGEAKTYRGLGHVFLG